MSGPPAWGFGVRLTTIHCKNIFVQKQSHKASEDRNYWRVLVNAALNLWVPQAMELVVNRS